VILTQSQTLSFTATVGNTSNMAVTWSISPSVGSISPAGLYTAPSSILTSQTVTVTAQSVADPTKSASVAISCIPVTYYVDSVNGLDSNPGTEAAPWQTIAKVNATNLLPGQTVAFASGRVWREQLTVSHSGSAGEPITFTSYGGGAAPIISGANLVTNWTPAAKGYYASYTTAPNQVFRNGARLNQVSTQSALVTGSWWLDTATSQIYVFDNPSGQTIEASQRPYAIYSPCSLNGYITINGLQLQESNNYGFYECGYGIGWVISNGFSLFNAGQGIRFDGAVNSAMSYETAAYNGADGLAAYQTPNLLIDHCITHHNVLFLANYEAGIKIEPGTNSTNVTVQYSTSYSNGIGGVGTTGSGIWGDTIGNGWTVRHNTVYSNNDWGINVDADNFALVYENTVYSNGSGGIAAYADGSPSMTGNKIYNNTIWSNANVGLNIGGPASGSVAGGCMNNVVQNNISIGSTGSLHAYNGCENPGKDGSGNTYTYNSLGAAAPSFILWGSTWYSTYAAWETAVGNCGTAGCTNSMQQNPMLNAPSGGDFSLQSGSPAVGAGLYIPGIASANPPNIGAN
jgi:hypothetical protein